VGEKMRAYRALLRKPEGKRRLTRRWKDNFKTVLKEIE
jgi:hypothetical protein